MVLALGITRSKFLRSLSKLKIQVLSILWGYRKSHLTGLTMRYRRPHLEIGPKILCIMKAVTCENSAQFTVKHCKWRNQQENSPRTNNPRNPVETTQNHFSSICCPWISAHEQLLCFFKSYINTSYWLLIYC